MIKFPTSTKKRILDNVSGAKAPRAHRHTVSKETPPHDAFLGEESDIELDAEEFLLRKRLLILCLKQSSLSPKKERKVMAIRMPRAM